MASRKQAVKKTGAAKKSGGKSTARKGTAPKVARAQKGKVDPKRSAAGRAGATARWAKEKRASTTGSE
jgi:hypothetical protein